MRLDNVIQFRVSSEEKEELQRRAAPHGLSRLIREALGLPVADKVAPSEETAPTKGSGGMDPKELTRLARERHPTLPLAFAEMKVRAELR